MDVITGSKETSVYIIDADYRIVHFNNALTEVFPTIESGELCYEVLCGESEPCRECPLSRKTNQGEGAIFYNKKVDRWLEVTTGEIDWPGSGTCYTVLCREIHEGNKNLFYNLTNVTTYDELFELNLTHDSYKILYHLEGKYVLPAIEGSLSSMITEVAENMIHPEDKERFAEFWDIEEILEKIQDGVYEGTLRGEFRKKLTRGGYSWVSQIVVPLLYGENSDKIIMCFIQDIDAEKLGEQQGRKEIKENERDLLTGLYRKNVFFKKARDILDSAEDGQYCLMAIDIEHFKLFNEWYGQESGDRFLKSIAIQLKSEVNRNGGIAGYMGDDDFCIILPNEAKILEKLQNRIIGYMRRYGDNSGFLPAFGIFNIVDKATPIRTMYDRACIAIATVKGNYACRVCHYDIRMMQRMEANHMLLSEIQRALKNGEFTFYGQPKCNMATGKILGLESLVRWNHPERGLIAPGEFIPMLERNGLISDLDLYLWEEVCKALRTWIDKGIKAIPISVNVSRMDIYTLDVVSCFKKLLTKYELPFRLLEIEITESAYAEEHEHITNVINELRKAGFTVLMDDFGSGYSSLNMLKDVKVDILKIDMKFLDLDEKSADKGMGILETIIRMARLMEMPIIAEGVETESQMDFLLEMGCLYGQGYYFYKPMPKEKVEDFLKDENNIDYRGIKARQTERIHIKDLLNEDAFSEVMLNNILGGVAFYDVYGDQIELTRVNELYYKVTGTNPVDLEESRSKIVDYVYAEDRAIVQQVFRDAYKNVSQGGEGEFRRYKDNGDTMWMHLRAFFLREIDGHGVYYGSVSDVTRLKQKERQLEASRRALTAVVDISSEDTSFMELSEENRRTAASILAQMSSGGLIGGYCEDDFPLYFANKEIVRLLGYDNFEEFADAIDRKVINTIHPDDVEHVYRDIGPEFYVGLEYTTTYRMPHRDGSWFWTLDKGRVIKAEDGRLAIISACTDISESIVARERLAEKNYQLQELNQQLHFLNDYLPGGFYRCTLDYGYEITYMSNRFLDILGYTKEEIYELFDNKYLNMVHPADRCMVESNMVGFDANKDVFNMEYRILSERGYIWVAEQAIYLKYNGESFAQGVILDVTEMMELHKRMKRIMKHTTNNIIFIHYRDENTEYETIANGLFRNFGYTEEGYNKLLNNQHYRELIDPEDMKRLDKMMLRAVERHEGYQDIIKMEMPDGQRAWINLEACYMGDEEKGVSYLCNFSDISSVKEKEQELELMSRKIESILRMSGLSHWEWDIQNRRLTVSNVNFNMKLARMCDKFENRMAVFENFPDSLLNSQNISQAQKEMLREFMNEISGSRNRGRMEREIPFFTGTSRRQWMKIVYEVLNDETGNPVNVLGYYLDITDQKEEVLENRARLKAMEVLRGQSLYDFKANVSRDEFMGGADVEGWMYDVKAKSGGTFTDKMEYLIEKVIFPEFRAEFRRLLNRDTLLGMYKDGKKTLSVDYKRMYMDKPKWFRMTVHLVEMVDSQDVFAYIFITDIDKQKKQELYLTKMAETDALTGLYNRQTAIPKIKDYLSQKLYENAAMVMFDLDNFKVANDVFGHAYGDSIITAYGHKLRQYFREEDIVCRIGGDEFMVFCRDIQEDDIEKRLAEVVDELVTIYENDDQRIKFTVSAGLVIVPEQGKEFDELYRKADIALFTAKMDGKSSYRKYNKSMKAIRYELADR